MKEKLEYRGESIVETDEGPMGHPDGTWVLSRSSAGWHICYTAEMGVLHPYAGGQAIASREAAWLDLCRFIDEEQLHLATMDKKQEFSPEVLHHAVSRSVQEGGYWINAHVEHVKAEISIDLLMQLHNALSADDPLRPRLRDELRAQAAQSRCISGLISLPSGDLVYDENRATAAMQRAKLTRYVDEVQDNLSKLALNLQFVLGSSAEEASAMSRTNGAGEPLVELKPLSPAARALTAVDLPLLEVLNGLAVRARSTEADLPQSGVHKLEQKEG